jgi:hypothetical protein
MDFNSIDELKLAGFEGFLTIKDLFFDKSRIPKTRGVYMVLNPRFAKADLVAIGTGGHFKGKNPNVSLDELQDNWVENSLVVYIGKAGGEGSRATLNSRLGQYLQFGQGRDIGHYGGRYIWQLSYATNLLICWKPLPKDDPRTIEKLLLQQFIDAFHKRPFANLTG